MPILTALSYNIHECVGLDRRRDPSRIARIIKASGAQIVGLQEVHSDSTGADDLHQMNYLAANTGLSAVPGTSLMRRNGQFGNVLLTSAKVQEVRQLDLSYPDREPRGAIDTDLEFSGETMRVIVAHLGLLPAERRFQVEKLLQILRQRHTRMVVVLSDFNEWLPTGRALRWLHTRLGKTALVRTFPASFPVFALDRIWVSPSSALVEIGAIRTPITRVASDHLPLKAVLCTPQSAADWYKKSKLTQPD